MSIYHFIYKTTHINGNYYYGRHTTKNLDDGYMGSGTWIRKIRKLSNLSREIIEYTDSVESLKDLEQKYLDEHFGKPRCMNRRKSSCGFDSETNPMKTMRTNKGSFKKGHKPIFSPESNKKKSLTKMGKNNPMFGKPEASKHLNVSNKQCTYCGITTTIGNIGRWHNEKCKLVPIFSV